MDSYIQDGKKCSFRVNFYFLVLREIMLSRVIFSFIYQYLHPICTGIGIGNVIGICVEYLLVGDTSIIEPIDMIDKSPTSFEALKGVFDICRICSGGKIYWISYPVNALCHFSIRLLQNHGCGYRSIYCN